MNWVDFSVLAALALWLVASLRSMRKRKGTCCGDCAKCAQTCKRV